MPTLISSEITIIGAGPAGMSAAMSLAKKGIPCLLIEKAVFPRRKICGDGLSGKTISILRKIDPSIVDELKNLDLITESRAVKFFSPSMKSARIGFNPENPADPPGFICKRIEFDNLLFRKIKSLGQVSVLEEVQINQAEKKDGQLILNDTSQEITIETRLVLIATGTNQNILRLLAPEYLNISGDGVGIRGYFSNVSGIDNDYAIEIHFIKELLPWYFWIFPFNDGSANAGLALPMGIILEKRIGLSKLMFELIEKYPHLHSRFKNAKLEGQMEAARISYFTGRKILAGDNFMILGDLASLIDPFTGEGIGNAMASGMIAADVAEECFRSGNYSTSAVKKYEDNIYLKVESELSLGLKLHMLARRPRLLNLVIGRAAKNKQVQQLLEEMLYNMNTKRQLSKPLFYLKMMLNI